MLKGNGAVTQADVQRLLRTLAPLMMIVAAVWALRLILHEVAAPAMLVRFLSVSGVVPVAILLASMLIHLRELGGYTAVAVASFALAAVGELLIVAAIVFSLATGWINVFSEPEFSFPGGDPFQLIHITSHLIRIPLVGLLGMGMGSLILWLMRRVVPEGAG